jgi:hypothetical protein
VGEGMTRLLWALTIVAWLLVDSQSAEVGLPGSPSDRMTDAELEACRKQYVRADGCQKWIADNVARKAARHADEEARKEARKAGTEEAERNARKVASEAYARVERNTEAKEATKAADSKQKEADSESAHSNTVAHVSTDSSKKSFIPSDLKETTGFLPSDFLAESPLVELSSPGGQGEDSVHEAVAVKDSANAKWCESNYMEAKDCAKWVADQLAREAARHADEEARKEARKVGTEQAEEEARKVASEAYARVERNTEAKQATKAADSKQTETVSGSAHSNTVAHVSKDNSKSLLPSDFIAASPLEGQLSEAVAVKDSANAKWCESNYVEAKDCAKWVADQLAREAARHADNEDRKEARLADEKARKEDRKADENARKAAPQTEEEQRKTTLDATKTHVASGKASSNVSSPVVWVMFMQAHGIRNKTKDEKWCESNRVEATECSKWVADQLAREVARHADEEDRKEARLADEKARKDARKVDEKARDTSLNSRLISDRSDIWMFACLGLGVPALVAMSAIFKTVLCGIRKAPMSTPLLEEPTLQV